MIGACQQNSGIFLVRGGGAGRDADGCRGWAGSGTSRDRVGGRLGARCRRGPRLGLDEMPTTKSPGPGLGPGRDSDDQITGAGGNQINSKENAL